MPDGLTQRLTWRVATVVSTHDETPRTRTIVLDIPDWPTHRAGQHVDVRLVAEDGYEAQRSYSIASAPEDGHVALTVERLDDGEVSSYLTDVLRVGDGLEVRGPIGGWFAWNVADGGPLFLIGGGSGVVPLMAMLRHHAHASDEVRARTPARLLYSARTWNDVIYRDELARLAGTLGTRVTYTLTREPSPAPPGSRRRVDRAMLVDAGWPSVAMPHIYVCGPTPFVESVAALLVDIGHDPAHIRTERFGPTG